MTLDLPLALRVVQFIAVFSRISGILFLSLPALNSPLIPLRARAGITIGITFLLMPVLPQEWHDPLRFQNLVVADLILIVLSEVLLGMFIALVIRLILETITIAGFIIDRNVGFAMARTVDPTLETGSTIMATFMMQVFVVIFLIFDVHLEVIRLLAFSFQEVGPGEFVLKSESREILYLLGSKMFSLGFRLALPIFTIILFTNIAMALMARFGQEFEVMMLSFPIRLGLGLLTMAMLMPVFVTIFHDLNDQLLYWMAAVFTL